jgi:hypothetical protein
MRQDSIRITGLIALMACGSAFAASPAGSGSQTNSGLLPELQCDRFNCVMKPSSLASRPMQPPAPAAANPNPVVVGPPAGQRYGWLGASYPTCQSVQGTSIASPYEYFRIDTIPVPLGSTHVGLRATVQTNIGGGPSGSAGVVGFLQLSRAGTGNWVNTATSYLYSIGGYVNTISLYTTAPLQGLESLASLPPAGAVPDAIDVRLTTFVVYSGDGQFTRTDVAAVCQGKLEVTF